MIKSANHRKTVNLSKNENSGVEKQSNNLSEPNSSRENLNTKGENIL